MENGKLTAAHLPAIYKQLSEDLPPEGIEKAPKEKTRKGYDTTGYGYQFHVNRLNDVLFGHWRAIHKVVKEEESKTSSGKPMYKVVSLMIVQLGNWISVDGENRFEVLMEVEGYGGHSSLEAESAYKGSYTNAFKKATAMLGVGRKAFEGTLDDDIQGPGQDQKQKSSNNQPNKHNQQPQQKQQTTQRKQYQQKQPAQQSSEYKMTKETLDKIKSIWDATALSPDVLNKQTDKYFKLPLSELSESQGKQLLEIFAAKKSESKEQKKNRYASLFAAGREQKLSQEQVKEIVYDKYSIESLTKLDDLKLTEATKWIKTYGQTKKIS